MGKQLLIIEDEPRARWALHRVLGQQGYHVTEATTLAEGLTRLRSGPDCVVLDLELPDGPGEEVLRRVRAAGSRTRVVVTSGISDPERLAESRALGAAAVLPKPIDAGALCRTLEGAG